MILHSWKKWALKVDLRGFLKSLLIQKNDFPVIASGNNRPTRNYYLAYTLSMNFNTSYDLKLFINHREFSIPYSKQEPSNFTVGIRNKTSKLSKLQIHLSTLNNFGQFPDLNYSTKTRWNHLIRIVRIIDNFGHWRVIDVYLFYYFEFRHILLSYFWDYSF